MEFTFVGEEILKKTQTIKTTSTEYTALVN